MVTKLMSEGVRISIRSFYLLEGVMNLMDYLSLNAFRLMSDNKG